MRYRALFFDWDGTLTSLETHRIPPSALEALELAGKRGIKRFLATGRHPEYLDAGAIDQAGFDGFLTCNGQYCFNNEEIISRRYIPEPDILALVEKLRREPYSVMFIREENTFINLVDGRTQAALDILGMHRPAVLDPETQPPDRIFTLLLPDGEAYDHRTMSVMPGSRAVRWHPAFTDVIPADGGKDAGIDAMLDYYGISLAETMAFGDAENDIAMLEHVGLGVAMGGATPAAMAAADYITASVEEDGLWKAMRHFGVI